MSERESAGEVGVDSLVFKASRFKLGATVSIGLWFVIAFARCLVGAGGLVSRLRNEATLANEWRSLSLLFGESGRSAGPKERSEDDSTLGVGEMTPRFSS